MPGAECLDATLGFLRQDDGILALALCQGYGDGRDGSFGLGCGAVQLDALDCG